MDIKSMEIAIQKNSTSVEIAGEITSTELVEEANRRSSDKGSSMENITRLQEQIPSSRNTSGFYPNEFGSREDYFNFGVPLHEASITGDWETAKFILDSRPEFVRFAINNALNTALHVAATAEETKLTLQFVKNLVNMMTKEDLELQNNCANTAFSVASACGNLKMAMIMLEKNRRLQYIRGGGDIQIFALSISASSGKYNLVRYLYANSQEMTNYHWTERDKKYTLYHCVNHDFFDVALQIVKKHEEIAANKDVLKLLARKPYALNREEKKLLTRILDPVTRCFCTKVQHEVEEEENNAVKLLKIIWRWTSRIVYVNQSEDVWTIELFAAAELGNTRFVAELLRTYPHFGHLTNNNGHTIFHIAVMHRHQGVYNLLYEMGSGREDVFLITDEKDNNMLHLIGTTTKKMRFLKSGASLLMQRELLWYKEVEDNISPALREAKNKLGKTPHELFRSESEDLVSTSLDWMKDCMVVATLIVTVAFAVAFTVPGGYNQETGIPIRIHGTGFLVFVLADAITLFSSSTSLLVFLSVLTSRHAHRDFLYSLPKKLMIGLITLFISVVAMMVTFSASFFVLYHKGLKWVPILISSFSCVPVIVFAILQSPLVLDMFRSMYNSQYLFNPTKRILYTTNRRLPSNHSPCYRLFTFNGFIIRFLFARP